MSEFGELLGFWAFPFFYALMAWRALRMFRDKPLDVIVCLLIGGGLFTLVQLAKIVQALEELHHVLLIYGQVG